MATDLQAVRDRIKALNDSTGGPLFATVLDIISAGMARETGVRTPAAFVATATETAAPNRTQGVHDQAVTANISVMMVHAARMVSDGQVDEVEFAKEALITSLAGWTPPGARKALDYASFNVLEVTDGFIWTQLVFTTGHHLRN